MPSFAANLSMLFTEREFTERFAAAARAGFKAVEYLFPYDWEPGLLAGLLKENGLRQELFNIWPGDWAGGERGLACLPRREAECLLGVEKALPYAEALGCRKLHLMAGIKAQELPREEAFKIYKDNVAKAAKLCGRHGLTLCLEPINRISMPGYLLNRQSEAVEVIEELGLPNLKLQFDFFHCQMEEGCVALKMREYHKHIGHYQAASVPDRNEPDGGELNYAYLFALVDELGYTGSIGCEYKPRGRTEDGLGWLERFFPSH